MRAVRMVIALPVVAWCVSGCSSRQATYAPAPPVTSSQLSSVPAAPQSGGGVYGWQDVPRGQQVPIARVAFDQGGYQVYAASGETILVPFVNRNLNVMRFGRSQETQSYFVNEGDSPVLYLRNGDYLENAAAQNARWYPIPPDFNYTQPVYVSLAPSWADYTAMGWYPGMSYYGGMWGYRPGVAFAWMPGFYVGIGGHRYTSYTSYRTYYSRTPGFSRMSTVYNYSAPRTTGSWRGSSGVKTTGSFGSRWVTSGTGSFSGNRAPSAGASFGGAGASRNRGSFGSPVYVPKNVATGAGPAVHSSFGSTGGSVAAPRATTGGSFGGGRSTMGGSFGGGTRSTFGGGGRSFGGRRR